MSVPSSSSAESTARNCPSCGVTLAPEAVLCIACGYHPATGRRLQTIVQHEPAASPTPAPVLDSNPFASPESADVARPIALGERPEFDLTEAGARRAQGIVSEAKGVYTLILITWIACAPGWFIMVPWFAFRLYSWHRLNAEFSELRSPNSFSPHGQLAAEFQDARSRLLIGIIAGTLFWVIVVLAVILRVYNRR